VAVRVAGARPHGVVPVAVVLGVRSSMSSGMTSLGSRPITWTARRAALAPTAGSVVAEPHPAGHALRSSTRRAARAVRSTESRPAAATTSSITSRVTEEASTPARSRPPSGLRRTPQHSEP
jgi:hypothetical protein